MLHLQKKMLNFEFWTTYSLFSKQKKFGPGGLVCESDTPAYSRSLESLPIGFSLKKPLRHYLAVGSIRNGV